MPPSDGYESSRFIDVKISHGNKLRQAFYIGKCVQYMEKGEEFSNKIKGISMF
jgi:hypothetical protein